MFPNYRIAVEQYLNRELGEIYAAINSQESCDCAGSILGNDGKTTVKLQFYSPPDGQPPSVKVGVFS